MYFHRLYDKKIIEDHFRKNIPLNLYQIGDLDDFFFEHTKWFAVSNDNEILQIILLYSGGDLPVILALCDKGSHEMKLLLENIIDKLPEKFYSHLSPGLAEIPNHTHKIEKYGTYSKMYLERDELKNFPDDNNIRRLIASDMDEIKKLYDQSYPGNWYDKRMMETGKYFGYYENGKLAGISGIHVYSPSQRVAVLGNITTSPEYRGKSICTKLTYVLCNDLFKTCDVIGLNVNIENTAAIRSYEKVGFKKFTEYEEYMISL